MKEDRLEDLLRAMDHPEEYTEEALQQLLSDEENRECYELAVKAHAGFKLVVFKGSQMGAGSCG